MTGRYRSAPDRGFMSPARLLGSASVSRQVVGNEFPPELGFYWQVAAVAALQGDQCVDEVRRPHDNTTQRHPSP